MRAPILESEPMIECWFCDTCKTLTLLAKAKRGECTTEPRRPDCLLRVPDGLAWDAFGLENAP